MALALALLATLAPGTKTENVDSGFDVVEWVYGETVSSR
jgi:hypothetical protein